jgi:hypothetical protein
MDLIDTSQNVADIQTLLADLIHCIDEADTIRVRLQALANRNASNNNQALIDESNTALTATDVDARIHTARAHMRTISLDF